MLPLSRALMMASTGVSAQEAELRISHSKTTLSFYAQMCIRDSGIHSPKHTTKRAAMQAARGL